MPKLRKAPLILFCLAVPLAAWAGDFWVKKPYQSWSADEAQTMLGESPWATTLTLAGIQNVAGTGASPGGEMEDNPKVTYTIQFRSALPIRQAQVRSSEINAHYDKMSAPQRTAFDANVTKFLSASFPDRIIVAVTFQSNVQNYQSQLRTYWTDQSLPKQSMKVFLNTRAGKLSITSYNCNNDTFQFTFPRPKELPPDDKIGVEFVHPRIQRIGEQRIVQVFNLKKMLVNGQPAL
ncbi:MAG: hypothetical protein J2P13_02940 [Acidobacteria bacterium]|nr:hypothetical protein [Acidobacteriota bacterium]